MRKVLLWRRLLLLTPLLAQELRADPLEFNTIYRSPYFLGRGDTGVATADNHEAIFYNPAGIAQGKGIYKETVLLSPSGSISTETRNLVKEVLVEEDNNVDTLKGYAGKNLHLGISNFSGVVFRRFALGALVSADSNVMLTKAAEQNGMDTLQADAALNKVLTISAAEGFFGDSLYLGTTLKYLMRNEANLELSAADSDQIKEQLESEDVSVERRGYGIDIGAMYKLKSLPMSLGLHIENLGSTLLSAEDAGVASRRMPQIVTIGAAIEKNVRISSMTFLVDFRDALGAVETNTFKRLHLGGEVKFAKFVGVTGGLNQGYPTAGFFVNLYVVRLDMGIMTQEVGSSAGLRPDQRLVFRLMAGF